MTVELPAELAADFAALAAAEGCSPEEYLRKLLEREVRANRGRMEAIPANRAERYSQLRREIVASGVPLLNDEQLRDEIRARKGLKTEPSD